MRVHVTVLRPGDYLHSLALWDIARLLRLSLDTLGHAGELVFNECDPHDLNIILGYHLVTDSRQLPDVPFVIYQLEQLSEREGWFRPVHRALFERAVAVWDYAPENLAFLQSQGVTNTTLVPIGYHDGLRTIGRQTQDIDVLFFGSLNDRRQTILEQLRPHCRLETVFGVYGEQRDQYIARSKIVLNVHYYQAQVMEQVRISHLLNNRCFVVSEDSPVNPYGDHLLSAPFDQLAGVCLDWLGRPEDRYRQAKLGFDWLRQRPMIDDVRSALAGLCNPVTSLP